LTAYFCESGKRPVRRKKKAKEKNPEEKETGRKRIRKKKRPEGKITERKWGRKKKGSYAVVKVCKRKGLTVGKCVSLQDQLVAFLVLLLQPRGLLLSTLPGLGQLLQLSSQYNGGVAGVLQSLVHLGRCISFSGFEGLGVVKPQLNELRLELLVAGLVGAQLLLMLPDELVFLPCNPEKKMLTRLC
jgi:hypothetical protein